MIQCKARSIAKYFGTFPFPSIAIVNVVTLAEMVFRLHVGFLDKETGKVITYPIIVWENYLKKKSNFLCDLFSLMPLWILHFWFRKFFDVTSSAYPYGRLFSMAKRATQLVPIFNIWVQGKRGIQFFNVPSQARPYNRIISQMKFVIHAAIKTWVVILVGTSIWIIGLLGYISFNLNQLNCFHD